jgi:hypothetical protein
MIADRGQVTVRPDQRRLPSSVAGLLPKRLERFELFERLIRPQSGYVYGSC